MADGFTAPRYAWDCTLSDGDVGRLANEIEQKGYGVLEGYIGQQELEPIQALARGAVDGNGGEYIAFTGSDEFIGTTLERLPRSGAFKILCQQLYEHSCKQPAPPVEFYQITRMLKGHTSRNHSYNFHYDSYVLTVLMPIDIPASGLSGDLIIFPNKRPFRKNYLTNLADKLFMENALVQRHFLDKAYKPDAGAVAIKMIPGNIYFFWGYRTLHTNEPCDPDKLRVTSLLHYGDPHEHSRLRALLRR